jgi:ATP-dependent Clp protease adapter protein ClpS
MHHWERVTTDRTASVNSRKFYVSLDEITQNFAFAERFSGSYTKTVTLSNGSTRTVKLTPMVHDEVGDVVELNDSGHISYMGLNGTTTNGNLMVQLREIPMSYPDEKSCAVAILSSPMVQALYRALGSGAEDISARVNDLPEQQDNPDSDHILMAETPWQQHAARGASPIASELRLLCGLLLHGTPEVKDALTPSGRQAGDVVFRAVHGEEESDLRSRWPPPEEQTGQVLLLNDPFTQMKTVTDALQTFFGMDRQSAMRKMLEVHESGASVLELAPGSNLADECRRLNAQWRSMGLPLYCAPQRLDTARMGQP